MAVVGMAADATPPGRPGPSVVAPDPTAVSAADGDAAAWAYVVDAMHAAATSTTPTSAIAEVPVGTAPMARIRPFLPDGFEDLRRCAVRTHELLADRSV
jgi:hypothetical protein